MPASPARRHQSPPVRSQRHRSCQTARRSLRRPENASGLDAPIDDAGNDRVSRHQTSGSPLATIIQKEQQFGALHEHVDGAHGDRRYPTPSWRCMSVAVTSLVPAPSVKCQYLQHDAVQGHFDQSAKAADAAQHFPDASSTLPRLDPLDQLVAGVDVDPGVAIALPALAQSSNGSFM